MWVAYWLGMLAGLMVISQLVPFAKSVGIPGAALITMSLVVGAVGNASGRILSGWMSDAIGRIERLAPDDRHLRWSPCPCSTWWAATSPCCMPWCSSCTGATARRLSVNGAATADFWGTKNAGINYGMLFTAWGLAGYTGAKLGGMMYDKYHNYQMAFYTAGILAAVALVCELVAKRPAGTGERA